MFGAAGPRRSILFRMEDDLPSDERLARDWPAELDRRIAAVATASDPYQAALRVTTCAVDYLVTSVVASRLYVLWAELQDRVELQDATEGVAAMRRAATEWLAAAENRASCEDYLDRWQYDVLGFERPS